MLRMLSHDFTPVLTHGGVSARAAGQGQEPEGTACHFDIDWSRIFPKGVGARADAASLGEVSRQVDRMLAQGLQPWATLHQGQLPPALLEQGGWLKRSTIGAFADFARLMGEQLGDRVRHWITHDDPGHASLDLNTGSSGGSRALHRALQISHHRLISHGEALRALRSAAPGAQVGLVLSLQAIRPASHRAADLATALRQDGLRNRWWLDPLFGRGYPGDVLQALGVDAPTVLPGDLRSMASPCDFLAIRPQRHEQQASYGPEPEVDAARILELLERVHHDYTPPALYLISPEASAPNPARTSARLMPSGPSPHSFPRTERVSF
ncbi:family 1 glycosylhydrolase [Roseateles sp.]|uniref:family 1 glycosylhydrolase n=1 Tax=Roseateles sp. TaxID=1971397 RepID=UPI003D0A607C